MLTATVKADLVTRDGKKTSGGVTTSFQARDSQGRTRIDQPLYCFADKDGQSHWEGQIESRSCTVKGANSIVTRS